MTPYGVKVWNTEAGSWDQGFYQGDNSNYFSWGRNLWPQVDAARFYKGMLESPETIVQNFLRTIGSGFTKYFDYDARLGATTPSDFASDSTLLEGDGSIRAKGIAYAIAGHFIDHSTAVGDLKIDANSYSYLFNKNGAPILALRTQDKTNQSLTVSLAPS